MQFLNVPAWLAPISTGHPFGLPATPRPGNDTQKVKAPSDAKSGDASSDSYLAKKPPAPFPADPDKEPDPATHVAPPSIMQMKITQMLNAQASEVREALGKEPDSSETHVDSDKMPETPVGITAGEASPGIEAQDSPDLPMVDAASVAQEDKASWSQPTREDSSVEDRPPNS